MQNDSVRIERCNDRYNSQRKGKKQKKSLYSSFQIGQTQRLIPVQILIDCWNVLRIVSDVEVKAAAGIHLKNTFAFPNTKHSVATLLDEKTCQKYASNPDQQIIESCTVHFP